MKLTGPLWRAFQRTNPRLLARLSFAGLLFTCVQKLRQIGSHR